MENTTKGDIKKIVSSLVKEEFKIRTRNDLITLQALPLDIKIMKTKLRIREFVYEIGLQNSYISFSGGKDSAVLLDIAREEFPNIKAIYCNTGLEYPEINTFVKTIDNVEIVRPKLSFKEVITKYGYPIASKEVARAVESTKRWKIDETQYMGSDVKKILGIDEYAKPSRYNLEKWSPLVDAPFKISDKCCYHMKKGVMNKIKLYSITGMIAEESQLRYQSWLKYGCNSFGQEKPKSNPMMFWTNQDILQYIKEKNLPIASIYGDIIEDDKCRLCTSGAERTGCVFCLFGSHREKVSRLKLLEKSHKQLYDYCMYGGEIVNGLWQPNQQGLGMKFVIDTANSLINNFEIKY